MYYIAFWKIRVDIIWKKSQKIFASDQNFLDPSPSYSKKGPANVFHTLTNCKFIIF